MNRYRPGIKYLEELLKITPSDIEHIWNGIAESYVDVNEETIEKAKKSWDEWVLTSTHHDFELESPSYKAHDLIMRQITLEAIYGYVKVRKKYEVFMEILKNDLEGKNNRLQEALTANGLLEEEVSAKDKEISSLRWRISRMEEDLELGDSN